MVETIEIVNKNTSELLFMDKLTTDDYILDYVDWGQATATQNTSRFINQVGVTINGVYFGSRNIEISGFIIADTEEQMTERKDFLNGFINPQNEYYAVYEEYKILFQPTTSIRYANTEEANNNEVICKFRINGVCPNPLFSLSADALTTDLVKIIPQFHFPFSITEEMPVVFGIVNESAEKRRKIDNIGDVEIGCRFKFIAKGEVENPTLHNYTTGQSFTLNKVLVANEIVEVVTVIGSKSVYGKISNGQRTNYFAYKTFDSDWITLKRGINEFGCTAISGQNDLDVSIQYEPQFLEVQKCY